MHDVRNHGGAFLLRHPALEIDQVGKKRLWESLSERWARSGEKVGGMEISRMVASLCVYCWQEKERKGGGRGGFQRLYMYTAKSELGRDRIRLRRALAR